MDRKRKLETPMVTQNKSTKKPKGSDNPDFTLAPVVTQLQKLLDELLKSTDVSEAIVKSANDLKDKLSNTYVSDQSNSQKKDLRHAHLRDILPPSATNSRPDTPRTNGLPPLPEINSEALLTPIFTHSSCDSIRPLGTDTHTYEPFEFLGDVYVELAATRLLHLRPRIKVNRKSAIRELCVKNETLAVFSRRYGLDRRLKIAGNLDSWGPKGVEKILGDVFEAYVAAVVEEHGYPVAEAWLWACWEPLLAAELKEEWTRADEAPPRTEGAEDWFDKDPKTGLARLLISPGVKLNYVTEDVQKIPRKGIVKYTVAVYLTGWGHVQRKLGTGVGHSVKLAGIEAAKDTMASHRGFVMEVNAEKIKADAERRAQREMELQASSSQP